MSIDKVETNPAETEFPWKHGLAMTFGIYLGLQAVRGIYQFACCKIGERFGISAESMIHEFWIVSIAPLLVVVIWLFWRCRDKSSDIRFQEAVGLKFEMGRLWGSLCAGGFLGGLIIACRIAYATMIGSKVRSPTEWLNYGLQGSTAVLITPIIEEIYYRGLLYNALCQAIRISSKRKRAAQNWALIYSSVFFGVGDPAGPLQITISGLIFGTAYRFSGNIWVPILLHAIMNLMAIEYWVNHGLI